DQNPELAREELRAGAVRLGYAVALGLEETGSGATNDRPGLAELLDAARRGKVEAVIVWKLDRFGRSALDLLANIRQLEDAGVRFVAVTQGIDTKPGGDPMSSAPDDAGRGGGVRTRSHPRSHAAGASARSRERQAPGPPAIGRARSKSGGAAT